jgi:Mycothiol maleylpyruvate isomerase N-terminal domain
MDPIDAYLTLADSAIALLHDPAVERSWSFPSALAEFSVSGLATHLTFQITRAPGVLLAAPPAPSVPLISLEDHYSRSRWVDAGVDSDVNRDIRSAAQEKADEGVEAVRRTAVAALAEIRLILPGEPPERPVFLPWTGWSLTLVDYLRTRALELLVHSDDLAISVGIETPEVPPEAARNVINTLIAMSVRKHGVTAVLRALSRRERAPHTIAAI